MILQTHNATNGSTGNIAPQATATRLQLSQSASSVQAASSQQFGTTHPFPCSHVALELTSTGRRQQHAPPQAVLRCRALRRAHCLSTQGQVLRRLFKECPGAAAHLASEQQGVCWCPEHAPPQVLRCCRVQRRGVGGAPGAEAPRQRRQQQDALRPYGSVSSPASRVSPVSRSHRECRGPGRRVPSLACRGSRVLLA